MRKIISIISRIHHHANKLITQELEKHDLSGLVPSHGDILMLLYEKEEGVSMSTITSSIHKDKSTVTTLVNKLEKAGLLEKSKSTKDSRSTIVKLTKKGHDAKKVIEEDISSKLLNTTYKNFSHEEKELVMILLEKIKRNFA